MVYGGSECVWCVNGGGGLPVGREKSGVEVRVCVRPPQLVVAAGLRSRVVVVVIDRGLDSATQHWRSARSAAAAIAVSLLLIVLVW